MEIVTLLFTSLFLTFASGYFSSSEMAFFSLSSTKIKTYKTSKDSKKRLIAELLKRPKDLIVTIFMLNTLVNILLQNTVSSLFGKDAGWDLKIGVPFLLTLVFGEIIPKYIGVQNNVSIAEMTASFINKTQNLLEPVRKLLITITEPISRLLFFFLKKEEGVSLNELVYLLKESEKSGLLRKEEADLTKGYLELQNSSVREIMRPREEILYFDIEEPLSELVYLFVDQQCSRIPVIKGKIDHILGIISVRQFFLNQHDIKNSADLLPFLSKCFYVPENTPAALLLRRFNEKNEEIAIIVDEYGSISGLITYEDLNEVVVGEIHDLRDQKKLYTRTNENEIIASGTLDLSTFNELFQADLKSENNMVTLSGFLIERLGDIPKAGIKYETDGFLFQVLAADPNRIKRIYVHKVRK